MYDVFCLCKLLLFSACGHMNEESFPLEHMENGSLELI